MARIEGEAGRMGGLVEDLLMLARLDDQRPLDIAEVDLTVLAADAAQDARAIDPDRSVAGRRPRRARSRPTLVPGDEAKLRQVSPTSCPTRSTTRRPARPSRSPSAPATTGTTRSSRCATTAPASTPTRRARCSSASTAPTPRASRGTGGGNGLGLAIVAAIVAPTEGRIGVARRPAGGGATFVVRAAQQAHSDSQAAPSTP